MVLILSEGQVDNEHIFNTSPVVGISRINRGMLNFFFLFFQVLFLFLSGTCTNRKCLITFKPGKKNISPNVCVK